MFSPGWRALRLRKDTSRAHSHDPGKQPAVPHTGADDQGRRRAAFRQISLPFREKTSLLLLNISFIKKIKRCYRYTKQNHRFPRVLSTGMEEERVKYAGEILEGIIKCLSWLRNSLSVCAPLTYV